jgi:hypothetical protein
LSAICLGFPDFTIDAKPIREAQEGVRHCLVGWRNDGAFMHETDFGQGSVDQIDA